MKMKSTAYHGMHLVHSLQLVVVTNVLMFLMMRVHVEMEWVRVSFIKCYSMSLMQFVRWWWLEECVNLVSYCLCKHQIICWWKLNIRHVHRWSQIISLRWHLWWFKNVITPDSLQTTIMIVMLLTGEEIYCQVCNYFTFSFCNFVSVYAFLPLFLICQFVYGNVQARCWTRRSVIPQSLIFTCAAMLVFRYVHCIFKLRIELLNYPCGAWLIGCNGGVMFWNRERAVRPITMCCGMRTSLQLMLCNHSQTISVTRMSCLLFYF